MNDSSKKYVNLIKTIDGVFNGLTQEEQLELIMLSPILKNIYSLGVKEGINLTNNKDVDCER